MSTETLALPQEMWDEIVAHSRELYPRECCGVIVGPAGTPVELHRLTTLEPGVDQYLVDDAELYARSRANDQRGWEFVAIYHSHPVSVAFPSRTDRELAFWEDAVYVICSLEHPDAPVLRAFRIVADVVTVVEIGWVYGVRHAEYGVGAGRRPSGRRWRTAPVRDEER